MEPLYPTPKDLVQALQERCGQAEQQVRHELRDAVRRLVDEFVDRHRLPYGVELLTDRALHAVVIYLRTRSPMTWEDTSWAAFWAALVLHVAKMTFHFDSGRPEQVTDSEPLPKCPAYNAQTFFLPSEQVGVHWTGGDWVGGGLASDCSLWVLIADVTGHGYSAYLLASNLPHVWRACWDGLASDCCQPTDLLGAIHRLLEGCLPEGVYVEGTLARLCPDGKAIVAPAGGTRLLLRIGGAPVSWHNLRGGWLGLVAPELADQRTWDLSAGDELAKGSDGLFDQIADSCSSGEPLIGLFANGNQLTTLFDAVHRVLQEALRQRPQHDDVSMVVVQKADTSAGADVST